MDTWFEWIGSLEWSRLVPEIIGKAIGFLVGFAASWFLLFRRRLDALQRLKRGDTDDIIFQSHKLCPIDDGKRVALVFRNLAPKTTLDSLYDNPAAQELMKQLADQTSLDDPILKTERTLGFEVLNDAAGHIAGLMATTPFPREPWLFVMTCEDRDVVRKKCIRCFLIRPDDLDQFKDWEWCRERVSVESPWHWFRVVALHRIALQWVGQCQRSREASSESMPLVDDQVRHDRVRLLSLGVNLDDRPIGEPVTIDWSSHQAQLELLGMSLESGNAAEEYSPASSCTSDSH
ncbi:MAG: hypothetical protein AAGA03_06190 [Planctomycetota bacterium]